MRLCEDCRRATAEWLDYDRTPVRGWMQYSASQDRRIKMSQDVKKLRIDDRAALIRRQCELIRAICQSKHQHQQDGATQSALEEN